MSENSKTKVDLATNQKELDKMLKEGREIIVMREANGSTAAYIKNEDLQDIVYIDPGRLWYYTSKMKEDMGYRYFLFKNLTEQQVMKYLAGLLG